MVKPTQILSSVRLQGASLNISYVSVDSRWFVFPSAITRSSNSAVHISQNELELAPNTGQTPSLCVRVYFIADICCQNQALKRNLSLFVRVVLWSREQQPLLYKRRCRVSVSPAVGVIFRTTRFLDCGCVGTGQRRPTAITALCRILYCTSDPALVLFLSCDFTSAFYIVYKALDITQHSLKK